MGVQGPAPDQKTSVVACVSLSILTLTLTEPNSRDSPGFSVTINSNSNWEGLIHVLKQIFKNQFLKINAVTIQILKNNPSDLLEDTVTWTWSSRRTLALNVYCSSSGWWSPRSRCLGQLKYCMLKYTHTCQTMNTLIFSLGNIVAITFVHGDLHFFG